MNTIDPERAGAGAGRLSFSPRDWPIVLVAVMALAIAIFVVAASWRAPDSPQARAEAFAVLGRNVDDVVLTNSAGVTVRWGELAGHPRAMFFGFTHCPEVCPTTMADISAAVERIGPAARDLRVDFISVDPERDTPQVLHDYFSGFGERFKGYCGARDQIDRLVRAFQASYQRTPLEGEDYTIDHTAIVYLLDRNGAVIDIVGYHTPPERLDGQLRGLLAHAEMAPTASGAPQGGAS